MLRFQSMDSTNSPLSGNWNKSLHTLVSKAHEKSLTSFKIRQLMHMQHADKFIIKYSKGMIERRASSISNAQHPNSKRYPLRTIIKVKLSSHQISIIHEFQTCYHDEIHRSHKYCKLLYDLKGLVWAACRILPLVSKESVSRLDY